MKEKYIFLLRDPSRNEENPYLINKSLPTLFLIFLVQQTSVIETLRPTGSLGRAETGLVGSQVSTADCLSDTNGLSQDAVLLFLQQIL